MGAHVRSERGPASGPERLRPKRAGQRALCNPGRTARPARLVSHFGNAVDVGVTSVP